MFRPQNVNVGSYFLQRIPDDKGGPGNPSAPIDVNAFRTTSGFHLPCAVPNFTGIPVVIAQPAYSVYPQKSVEILSFFHSKEVPFL